MRPLSPASLFFFLVPSRGATVCPHSFFIFHFSFSHHLFLSFFHIHKHLRQDTFYKMTSKDDDVLQFLDSLDGAATTTTTTGSSTAPASGSSEPRDRTTSSVSGAGVDGAQDEQSVLDFLDEITQSASSSTTPAPSTPAPSSSSAPSRYLQQQQQQKQQQQQQQQQVDSRSSWLGSLWSTASEAVKTTQTAVQSSVKATMESQAGKSLEERVKGFVNVDNIGKIGMCTSLGLFLMLAPQMLSQLTCGWL